MKNKIVYITLFLYIMFLFACVPTPDEEVVVNKSDSPGWNDVLSFGNTDTQHTVIVDLHDIPEHLTVTEQPQKNVKVVIDADVLLARDAMYPVLEVVPVDTVHDPEFCKRLLEQVCPTGIVYEHWERTKAEVSEQLKAALSYHGQSGSMVDQESLNTFISYFEEEYKNAPETVEKLKHNVSVGFDINQWYYVEYSKGVARLQFVGTNAGDYFGIERMMYCPEEYLEEDDEPLEEPKLSKEEAVRIGDAFIQKMDLECDALIGAEKGFTFYNYERTESIWLLDYVRKIDQTTTLDMRRDMGYSAPVSPSSTVGAPWEPERIVLAIGSDGVIYVGWSGLSKTSKILSSNAALYDFEQITHRIIEQLGFEYAWRQADDQLVETEIHVKEINLIYTLISEKDRDDVGIYIPTWEIIYVKKDLPNVVQRMYLSALDGGTLEPRLTKQELMNIEQ